MGTRQRIRSALVKVSVPNSPIFRGPLSTLFGMVGLEIWREDTAEHAVYLIPVGCKPTDDVKGNASRLERCIREIITSHAVVTHEPSTHEPMNMPLCVACVRLEQAGVWRQPELDRLYEEANKPQLNSQEQYLANMGIAA